MEAVAVYSDADAAAAHVRAADRAVRLGPAPPPRATCASTQSSQPAIDTGADAVHPGYGFLAERAAFARAVVAAGITWVGPPRLDRGPRRQAGGPATARSQPASRSSPAPSSPLPWTGPTRSRAILAAADALGFPLLVKAAAGGGGRGMRRVVHAQRSCPAALVAGSSEAAAAFGDGSVYLEREIRPARHIEVQLLGDRPAAWSPWASGTAPSSVGTRSSSRRLRPPGSRSRAPARPRDGGPRSPAAAGLTQRGDLRVPLRPRTALLVPRGQRPAPGGAPGDRARGRPRHRPEQFRLAAGRRFAEAVAAARARRSPAAMPSRSASPPRTPSLDSPRRPGRIRRWTMPAGPGHSRRLGASSPATRPAEYDPLIAKLIVHAGDRPTAHRPAAPGPRRGRDLRLQTTLPFHRGSSRRAGVPARPTSPPPRSPTTGTVRRRGPATPSPAAAGRPGGRAATMTGGRAPAPTTRGGQRPPADRRRGPGRAWRAAVGRTDAVDRWPAMRATS